jgi:hypothetical protein
LLSPQFSKTQRGFLRSTGGDEFIDLLAEI